MKEPIYDYWNAFCVNDKVITNRDLHAKTSAWREKNRIPVIVKPGSKGIILESTYTMNQGSLGSSINTYAVLFDHLNILTTISGVPEYCLEALGGKG